jgi:hypothetical protein
MSTSSSKLPKVKLLRSYHKLDTPSLYSFAMGLKFTGTVANNPPEADSVISTYAGDMMGTHNSRQTASAKTLTSTEKSKRTVLLNALDKNAAYLEGAANDAAIAAGDVEAGKALVSSVGFLLAGKRGGTHHTGVVNTGTGWAQVHEAKLKKGAEGHVWESGITSAKGVIPTSTKESFTLESTCIFNNIPSSSVFAYRHASVSEVGKKKTGGGTATTTTSSTQKMATSLIASNRANHPVIDFNAGSSYTFGDWRYVVIP